MDKNWGKANKGSLVVHVYCRPPDLGEIVNEVVLLQLQKIHTPGSDLDGGLRGASITQASAGKAAQ